MKSWKKNPNGSERKKSVGWRGSGFAKIGQPPLEERKGGAGGLGGSIESWTPDVMMMVMMMVRMMMMLMIVIMAMLMLARMMILMMMVMMMMVMMMVMMMMMDDDDVGN